MSLELIKIIEGCVVDHSGRAVVFRNFNRVNGA